VRAPANSRVSSYMGDGVPGREPLSLSQPDGYAPRRADYESASAGAARHYGRGAALLQLLMILGIARLKPVPIEVRRDR